VIVEDALDGITGKNIGCSDGRVEDGFVLSGDITGIITLGISLEGPVVCGTIDG